MRMRRLTILCMTFILAWPLLGKAETVNDAYIRALQDYYAGNYEKSVEGFERVLAVPIDHEDVHYNLGCAYFRLGKLGPAIYHFERALILDPAADDARFNLDLSRRQVRSRITDELKGVAGDSWWVRYVNIFRLKTWAILFLCLWWLTLGAVFALRFLHPGPLRAGLIASGSLMGLVSFICALLLAGRIYLDTQMPMGIILPDQIAVREGPNMSTKTSFKLHAGLRVRLLNKDAGWMRIRLANGLEGWVPEQEVGVL